MEQEKVNVMYDENGTAVRVQMDFDIYQWMVDQLPQTEKSFAVAR